MTAQPFPISDFRTGLFSAKEIWLAPQDAFATLSNARIDRGVVSKRQGIKTHTWFPTRIGNITGITGANPAVVTVASHGLSDNDVIVIRSVVGMTEVNNNKYVVANSTANTFELLGIDSSGFTSYSSGGTVDKLAGLQYVDAVSALSIVGEDSAGEDSQPSVTVSSHSLSTDDWVMISDLATDGSINGMPEINNTICQIDNPGSSTTQFYLRGVNTSKYTAYTSGAAVYALQSASGNAIMGIGERYVDESDNELLVLNQNRLAKLDNSLDELVAVSTSNEFTGSTSQLFRMKNAFDRMWITNFNDRVKTYDGTSLSDVDFDFDNDSSNEINRARFVFPYDGRMFAANVYDAGNSKLHAQRIVWSNDNYLPSGREWDQTSDDVTASSLDVGTDEELVDIGFLGDDVILFFERSIWAMKKTGQFDSPVRFQKLTDSTERFDSPFSSSSDLRFVWALSRLGFIATDGLQEFELDVQIPRWFDEIKDTNFPIVFGVKNQRWDEYWLSYASGNVSRNNKSLVYNYKEKAFYKYDVGFNCAGTHYLAEEPATSYQTLKDAGTTWSQLETDRITWGSFLRGAANLDVFIGDDYGRIMRLHNEILDDDGRIIDVELKTARLNPYKDQGQAANLVYLDLLFTEADTEIEVDFYVDFDENPIYTEKLSLARDQPLTDGDAPTSKVWKRMYTNLIGNTLQWRIRCSQQHSSFQMHAMIPYFRPAGRFNQV